MTFPTSPRADLNRRPRPYQGRALPAELPGRRRKSRQLSGVSNLKRQNVYKAQRNVNHFFCAAKKKSLTPRKVKCDKKSESTAFESMEISTQARTVARAELEKCLNIRAARAACKACANYAKVWSCPPYPAGALRFAIPKTCSEIVLIRRRAKFAPGELDRKSAAEAFKLLRGDFDPYVLDIERKTPGGFALLAGSCCNCLCGPGGCPRKDGLPCPAPEKLRPSLESLGFDAAKILEKFFGEKLFWGERPKELTLLAAVAIRSDSACAAQRSATLDGGAHSGDFACAKTRFADWLNNMRSNATL